MTNSIKLFDDQTDDGDSAEFIINTPTSKGYADTEFSAYLELYGSLGGGTLELHKEVIAGSNTFLNMKEESDDINTNFPTEVDDLLVRPINYKSGEKLKLVLTGATSPDLNANVYNATKVS